MQDFNFNPCQETGSAELMLSKREWNTDDDYNRVMSLQGRQYLFFFAAARLMEEQGRTDSGPNIKRMNEQEKRKGRRGTNAEMSK